jgi:hypothetical protein
MELKMNKILMVVLEALIAITEGLIWLHDAIFGSGIAWDDMPDFAPRKTKFKTPFSEEE